MAFAELGARVAVCDSDLEAAQRVAARLGAHGCAFEVDTSMEASVVKMAAQVRDRFGNISVLVNGAAVFIMRGLEATVDEWQKMFAVNVVGYALVAKHCVPQMAEAGGGAIVNIASISSFIAQPGYLTYNSTKGAVATMTKCMALDLAKSGIRVNAVCPGTVWTKNNASYLGRSMGLDREGADAHPEVGGMHLLRRTADPSEIAEPIVFLASDHASFITGEALMVDGGYTAV